MPPLHTSNQDSDEVIEIQHHVIHLNNHHQTHSVLEEINALLHSSTPALNNNGSHTGSGALPNSAGQGIAEENYSFLLYCTLLIPLIITIGAIIVIAVIVRRMRRSESMQEVTGGNEFGLKNYPATSSPPPSPASSSSGSQQGQYFGEVSPSPSTPTQLHPPWFIHSTNYYRSQYHLNKLQHQMSSSFIGSVQSLPTHSQYITDSLPNEVSSKSKRSSIKRFKRVFQVINIPKRIRQHQADKNRFNIYAVPVETREQLKQIYVY